MEEKEIEMGEKEGLKGKGGREKECLGAAQRHTAGEWAGGAMEARTR